MFAKRYDPQTFFVPTQVCVRELNTYLSLWKEDGRETIDPVLVRTREVLPILSTLENLLENPDEWEEPVEGEEGRSRAHRAKIAERNTIFDEMKGLQLRKLNRATYNLILDVAPMVDPESNLLKYFLPSDLGGFKVMLFIF